MTCFRIIEKGSEMYNKSCTQILFDEWGTSDRIRPSLGHLKYLLIKAELFRAADYVANLLGEEPASRPTEGPAAAVSLSLVNQKLQNEIEIKQHLDEINYPREAIEKIRKKSSENKNLVPIIPEIVVSEARPLPEPSPAPLVIHRPKSQFSSKVSDMIKFSDCIEDSTDVILPECSIFMSKENKDLKDGNPFKNQSPQEIEERSEFIPVFSKLLLNTESKNDAFTVESSNTNSEATNTDSVSELIPMVSALNHDWSSSQTQPHSEIIPDFVADYIPPKSDIIPDSVTLPSTQSLTYSSGDIPLTIPQPPSFSASSKCPSPVPYISLNTPLPHFTYAELSKTTSDFSSDKGGKFLGSGAFGSVFLATGLLDKPVAVKKLSLDSVDSDYIVKQFKNEVEVLYKYKHENLVSLLGYSFDSNTYCLVYEYIPGGSLYEALQRYPNDLLWKQRLHIAFGTAKGVAYLHNASTPLIHRDIKSANILLDANNNPKVCDFGIVKLLPGQLNDLESSPCGTSAYMSPEYHRGEISTKLDTFSFGVVLLELLTSLPPLDYNRDYADLVTYIEEHCENSEDIEHVVDKSVGSWSVGDENFAAKLFDLVWQCLQEVEKRLLMEEVAEVLSELVKEMSKC
ncbi:interleukin-1 receptor-associated kinase 4-like isoform X2 [Euwallacea fornicatus]|uniref:interleukin-1 receptor-associated kinase 4-like isoform X2 n=1 Tax=Euwallacea fornicatus TaxID=995702 RepID=UPI00338E74B3